MIVYIGFTCSRFIKSWSSHSGKFFEIRFYKNSQNFPKDYCTSIFEIFVHRLLIISYDFLYTAQKNKFSIKDLFSKCDQIRSFLRIWSHLLKKSLMGNRSVVCLAILYLESREIFQSLEFQFRIGKKTMSRIAIDVCRVIFEILEPSYISTSRNTTKWFEITEKFYQRWDFPKSIGAINGKHCNGTVF